MKTPRIRRRPVPPRQCRVRRSPSVCVPCRLRLSRPINLLDSSHRMLSFARPLGSRGAAAFSRYDRSCRAVAVQRKQTRYVVHPAPSPPKGRRSPHAVDVFGVRYYTSLPRTPPVPPVITGTAVSKDETRDFMAVFPDVVRDLTDTGRNLDVPDVTKWLVKLLQYNVPGGKKNRGLALVLSYKMLSPETELTDENLRLAYTLGWCVEILQAFQLVLDDIMDNAITRRGRPCWYRHNAIGLVAINDGILLEQSMYQLIKKYFKDKPYYIHILELFHDVTMKTSMGQCLDMLTAHSFKSNKLEKYTMENYKAIVKYKTAYYSFFLPVCLAMRMASIDDPEIFRQAKTILLEMGHFFQVQDDFLDCYGDPEVMGKIGTDIEDGKCSWLAVVALQKANSEQRRIMEENYGIDDPAKVTIIKDLYEQLKLPNTFQLYEEESYNLICTHIQQVSRGLSQDLFFKFLEKIYKRAH